MMKVWLLFLIMVSGSVYGQMTQYGRVVEAGAQGKPLQGVAITVPSVHDCQPTMSDRNGNYKLVFREHQVGDVVHGVRAEKKGYEVVNVHVTRNWTLTPKDSLRIVMAPLGQLRQAKERYYDMVEALGVSRYDSTMAFLKNQYEQKLLTPMAYEYWKGEAEAELQQCYEGLDALADRLARLEMRENRMEETVATALAGATSVLDTYQGFLVVFPKKNKELVVSSLEMDTTLVPDSLLANLRMMDDYAKVLEADNAESLLRYAKVVSYMGIMYNDAGQIVKARACFEKASAMYHALALMEGKNYTRQIERLDSWLKEL